MKKRWSSLLLCAAMLVSLCAPAAAEDTVEESPQTVTNVSYLDENGQPQTCAEAATANSNNWNTSDSPSGWYVASNSVEISSRVTVEGDVHLILKDGCELKATKGINVGEGNSLTIYAQSTDERTMGKLTATGSGDDAGIGGGSNSDGGKITINGGTVTATGAGNGPVGNSAGIGGGFGGNGGTIIINGGTVTATSGHDAGTVGHGAGIGGGGDGGGDGGNGGKIIINGGKVTATSFHGAGIGGGIGGNGGEITITDGVVTATSTNNGAGIGGGAGGTGGTITIGGGTVEATSDYGAGIGGVGGSGGQITISGNAKVEATSEKNGAGIGGGIGTDTSRNDGGEITISGNAEVTATSEGYGAGIGGGNGGAGGTITINGGTVTATGGSGGAGIGGGNRGNGGTITISGGTVKASSNSDGAGIGGGGGGEKGGAGGDITISGGTVNASSSNGAGIGGGGAGVDGTFSTGKDGSAIITTANIANTNNQDSWQGVFFIGDTTAGQVYGSPTLTTDMTFPAGTKLDIPRGTSLTIGQGATLSNNGSIYSEGTFEVKGTLENDGTISSHDYFLNNGTINNKDTIIIYEQFTNNGTLNNYGYLYSEYIITNNGTINNIGGRIKNPGEIDNTNGIIISDSEIAGIITGKPVHIHQWEAEWSSNSTHHWYECPGCPLENSLKDGYAAHDFGEWTTDKEATADTAGSRSRTCNICQYTETQTIPATGGGSSGGSTGGSGGGDSSPPTYKPEVEKPGQGGGTPSISPSDPARGDTVTVTPKPDEGYEVDKITVTDKNGKPVEVTKKPDGTYTFKQPGGKVKIEVSYKEVNTPWNNPFADVPKDAWYYEAVRFVCERGLMNGYADGRFAPEDTLSRAQLAQILFNKEGQPAGNGQSDFTDVSGGAWYSAAVCWAADQGIVGGYGNGTFGPNAPITREQLAVMLWRYVGSPATANKELHFNDTGEISGFALEAMRWAVENGILNGYGDGQLGPQGQATRAQVAQMLKNFIENQGEDT